eukprot:scaffold107224_cov69-Phaeocystis_antarctica.AAC.1
MAIQMFFRLTGVHLDAVQKRNGDWVPAKHAAKRQTPAMLRKFLGVVTDFTRFARTGNVPQARIDK